MSRPKDDNDADVPQELRPIDEQPPPDEPPIDEPPGDDPPPPPPPPPDGSGVTISQVSPIAGVSAGGIEVTLTGTGFQPGAEVFFGGSQSPEVFHDSETTVRATLPPATQAGSVTVSLVNPDGSNARLEGGFTYIATQATNRVEVLGVSPLAVIEDTETEVTIRGRNLIAAFNQGLVALRGPTRARVNSSAPITGTDEATGIEALTFTVRITATPQLAPLERLAIQVLASRADVAEEGIIESSRQMFTVLPRGLPVPLAFTENVAADRPALVMVAGRNLEGCSLDFGPGATVHMQASDDRSIVGIVSFQENLAKAAATPQFSVLNETGSEVAQYSVSLKTDAEMAEASATAEGTTPAEPDAPVSEALSPEAGDVGLNLTPVPDQQMVAATEEDSAVFSLGGDELFGFGFNYLNFIFRIVDTTIVISIVNEVRLIPFFDGGGARLNEVPVLAEVGKLLRLRGVGLLVALRIQIIIRIRVFIIIGYRFRVPSFDFFNEFDDLFPWGIGSLVISIYIQIIVLFRISLLVALVEPGGKLNVIARFSLRFGFIFELSDDRLSLRFIDLQVEYQLPRFSVGPLKIPFPCDGRFQLASDNGQTVFLDALQASQSFYLPRAPGVCCVPWNYDFELVEFDLNSGHSEVLQQSFRYEYCLNAAPAANLATIIITSQPEPETFPRRLVMDVADSATIIALAQPVDAVGNPIPGAPLQDVRDLGYDVEFVLEPASPDVLEPEDLKEGDAFAIIPGDNVIHARLWQKNRELPPMFNFFPEGVLGFNISSLLARGLEPAVLYGSLPVTVNPQSSEIEVKPTLAYRVDPNTLRECPTVNLLPNEVTLEMERPEPFEQPRAFVLAVKLKNVPADVSTSNPLTLSFEVTSARMETLAVGTTTPATLAPLAEIPPKDAPDLQFTSDRTVGEKTRFFTGNLIQANQKGTLTITKVPAANELLEVTVTSQPSTRLSIIPNIKEDATASPMPLVPPGVSVADRHVLVTVDLKVTPNRGTLKPIKPLRTVVANDENFEEYLRVFKEPEKILTDAGTTFSGFALSFYNSLAGTIPPAATLMTQGNNLWEAAYKAVQSAPPTGAAVARDDRPLYWARLRAIGALRAYFRRNNKGALNETIIRQFEWPSRGLEWPTGAISFSTATPGARQAIVTGFDPFFLPGQPDISNPSGLVALNLNRKIIAFANQTAVYVRTAIFPVRYKDFEQQIAENAVRPNLKSLVLLMTCSRGTNGFYFVDRFAGKRRGPKKRDPANPADPQSGPPLSDNNRGVNVDVVPAPGVDPPGVTPGAEFIESTLPYEFVITAVDDTRRLPGPAPQLTTLIPFLVNQSYWVLNVPRSPSPGKYRDDPTGINDDAGYEKKETPDSGALAFSGSGGFYLSNEIFYRTALLRTRERPTLASGHFHLPWPGPASNDPQNTGPGLLSGVETALTRFLSNLSHLRPVIVSFIPRSGFLGATVTITGERMDGALDVRFGGASSQRFRESDDHKQIEADLPPDAVTGFIEVETSYGTGVSSEVFTVNRLRPPIPEDFATLLRERRLALGREPRDVAQEIGVTPRTYTRWERGDDRPSARFRPAIIRFLGEDPNPAPQTLGERIRANRLREGLSQTDLAERLGVAPSTVKAWESDSVSRPTPRVSNIFETYLREA